MTLIPLLKRGYIEPFRDWGRSLVYLATFLGNVGFGGAGLYFAFDLASFGMGPLMAFFITRFTFSNFLLMPGGFYLISRFWGWPCFLSLLILSAAAGIIAFFTTGLPKDTLLYPVYMAFLLSGSSCSFWVLFHAALTFSVSDKNIGNDVSISGVIASMGNAVGLLLTGFIMIQASDITAPLLYSFLTAASFLLCLALAKQQKPDFSKGFHPINTIKQGCGFRTKMTIYHGIKQFLSFFAAPAWLAVLGVTSIVTGLLLAFNILIHLLSSPFLGHIFHLNKAQEIKAGTGFVLAGWLPWLISQNSYIMLLSAPLWGMGDNMIHIGVTSRWYQERSLSGNAAREILLGVGRLVACFICIPLLFLISPMMFFISAIFLSAAGVALSLKHKTQDRELADQSLSSRDMERM